MSEFTKDQAEKEADQLNKKALAEIRFCPLLKSTCRPDCVCWSVASIREHKYTNGKIEYSVFRAAGCGNMMFWRECEL